MARVGASVIIRSRSHGAVHRCRDFTRAASVTNYEMMESYWPAVARGDEEVPAAMGEGAVKLKAKHATPAGVLLGSGKLATELDGLDLIDEYEFLVHPRIA